MEYFDYAPSDWLAIFFLVLIFAFVVYTLGRMGKIFLWSRKTAKEGAKSLDEAVEMNRKALERQEEIAASLRVISADLKTLIELKKKQD